MANLTPTNLLLGFSKVTEKFQEPEFRMPNTAALSTAYLGEKLMNPMSELRTREDRQTWFDFLISKADEGQTERLHNHSGSRMDSLRRQITWGTVVDTFSISEIQCYNNSSSFDEVFAKGVLNSIQKNMVKFDDAFMVLLKAAKTQINLGGLGDRGGWNAATDIMEIANAQRDYWSAMIEANLQANDYNGSLIALTDTLAFIDMMKAQNQGTQNAVNLAYQFGNINLVKTNKQIYSGYDGSAIVFPADLVGLYTWIPKQYRKDIDLDDAMKSTNGSKGRITVPIYDQNGNLAYNLEACISIYTARANTTANNGNKDDMLSQVQISWDYAYMDAPLSTARATGDFADKTDSVVHAFGLLSS